MSYSQNINNGGVMNTPRFSNIECSRILAMFLIVAHHFSVHGGVPIWQGDFPLSFNFYLTQMISTGGKVGVDLFVLITGYFMASKISKLSSLVYLWLTTFFYVIIFFLVFCLFGIHEFSWSGLLACFFPIRNDFYWFVSTYFLLVLFSPFLTYLIQALGEKKLLAFLITFGIVWSVVPTITTKPEYYSSTLLWFIYLFCTGAYLKSFLHARHLSNFKTFLTLCATWSFLGFLIWLADINNRASTFIGYIDWFTFANMTSIFSLVIAICCFILFKQWNLSYKPWVNNVATAMLGVYLIHESPIVYPWLWSSVFNVREHLSSDWYSLYALIVISTVFIVCTLMDLLREHYMRQWFNGSLLPFLKPYDLKIKEFFSK